MIIYDLKSRNHQLDQEIAIVKQQIDDLKAVIDITVNKNEVE